MKKILRLLVLAVALTALFTACTQNIVIKTPSSDRVSSAPQTSGAEVKTTPTSSTAPSDPTTDTPTSQETTPTAPTDPTTDTETASVTEPTESETETTEPVTPTESESGTATQPSVDPEKVRPEDLKPFYPTEKVVAFTFDDGPCWVTPQILDVLEGTDDHVTFFIVGEMMDKNTKDYPSYVKRAYDMGCDIGSHTENHQNITKLSDEKLAEQLDKNQARFTAITGDKMHLMRPPGGSLDRNRKYGYAAVIWSVDSEDWRIYSEINKAHEYVLGSTKPERQAYKEEVAKLVEDATVESVLKQVQPGDIVLMHDIYFTSARAFKRIYAELKAQGYRFVTVSELLNIDAAEYDGWYFFSTRAIGHDGATSYAKKPASVPIFSQALLPEKIYGD